ncbi:MAG: cysteine--tRNA ligase [archaeon]|nr:cysteine--tRNA ligase [archaeon]
MPLIVYNTLSNKREEFIPIEKGKVKMYVCGVTVYDDIHMGHARSIISFDVVARYLKYKGYDVTYVTNFTDVDDKIIIKATQENIEPLELSKRYIGKYFEEIENLGVMRANMYPRASESVHDIIKMVGEIIDNGYGYVTSGGSVYFSVEKAKNFGCLTNKKIGDMISFGRIDSDSQKKNPLDFAVWKAAKPGEISWDSPWGKGRPGWHIECSAMIRHYLGDQIDIHGGGNDLIFPHHENEILQTEAVTGKQLARYWMHNGMLQVKEGSTNKEEKMSKSLGNFFRVRDVAKKYDKYTIRMFFLSTHYMSPLIYSEDGFREAAASLKRLWNNYRELQAYFRCASGNDDAADLISSSELEFEKAMDSDFNTPDAIKVIFNVIRATNRMISGKTLSKEGTENIIKMFNKFDNVLGIFPPSKNVSDDATKVLIEVIIDIRNKLRTRKMYDLADDIRDKLESAGIQLEDSADGVKWKEI